MLDHQVDVLILRAGHTYWQSTLMDCDDTFCTSMLEKFLFNYPLSLQSESTCDCLKTTLTLQFTCNCVLCVIRPWSKSWMDLHFPAWGWWPIATAPSWPPAWCSAHPPRAQHDPARSLHLQHVHRAAHPFICVSEQAAVDVRLVLASLFFNFFPFASCDRLLLAASGSQQQLLVCVSMSQLWVSDQP